MRRLKRSLREVLVRSPPRPPPTLESVLQSSIKEPSDAAAASDTAATSVVSIAIDPLSTPLAREVQSNSIVPSPAASGSLVSVQSAPAPSTNNAASDPAVSSAPPGAETTQANPIPPGPSKPSSSTSCSPGRAIIDKALAQLGEEERETVKEYASIGGDDPNAALDATHQAAKAQQNVYDSKGMGLYCKRT
jgi:hypothetical protein